MLWKCTINFCLSLSYLIITFSDFWLFPPELGRGEFTYLPIYLQRYNAVQWNALCACHCRSTSHATPCPVLTWKRPRPGPPGPPSTSLTTVATMSSASATLVKLASQTPAWWKWAGSGSRCATAPATDPLAAPLMVSGEWKRQMVYNQLSQALYLTPTGFLYLCRLVIGLLASSHCFCLLFNTVNPSFLPLQTSCKSLKSPMLIRPRVCTPALLDFISRWNHQTC